MATVLPIAQRGEAILKLQAAPVAQSEFNSEWLLQLAAAMQTTMLERHGVGIAAPQVYISKRIIIVASRPNPRYPDAPEMDAVVMVNPEILELSPNTCLGEEGCLNRGSCLLLILSSAFVFMLIYTKTNRILKS